MCIYITKSQAQKKFDEEAEIAKIEAMYKDVLIHSKAHDWLHYLCKDIGGRLGGSPEYSAAVQYTSHMLDSIGVDSVWTQEVMVPYWRRGDVEKATVVQSSVGEVPLSIAALGFSGGTSELGLVGEVVEVRSFEELDSLGEEGLSGTIVFFNREMDRTRLNTFYAYGAAVNQRTRGPREAAKYGAVGAIIRSMTVKYDDVPHSGVTSFKEQDPIPAVGIGLQSADKLHEIIQKDGAAKVHLQLSCQHMGMRPSYNVIGEIKGTEKPDEIIVVGGHLDSWDIGEGAHDDGAGCVQSMDVLHTLIRNNYKPRRTIRCVLFANEENGLNGANLYAELAKKNKENHYAAIESDAGGHVPVGFRMDAEEGIAASSFEKVKTWRSVLARFGLWDIQGGGSAADISRLKDQGTVLFGYRPDSQRYFDYHHSKNDVWENVHRRELVLGSASMAALVYLIDTFDVK